MDTFLSYFNGFAALTDPLNFAMLVGGFLVGTFFGAMPGLTSVLAIALLLPVTYQIDVVPALIMCASIFMSGMYSGSITAITINVRTAETSSEPRQPRRLEKKKNIPDKRSDGGSVLSSDLEGCTGAVRVPAPRLGPALTGEGQS